MSIDRAKAASAIEDFLRAIGRDPAKDPALHGTGARVTDAFVDDLCAGYRVDVARLLADNLIANDGTRASGGELVVVRDLAVTTTCPHHLMTASGVATVAFAPSDKLVGVGAVGSVVDAFAHRLTLQETIGEHVVDALFAALSPTWVACRLTMVHGCMIARGERRHGARVETLAVRGDVDRALVQRVVGQGAGERA